MRKLLGFFSLIVIPLMAFSQYSVQVSTAVCDPSASWMMLSRSIEGRITYQLDEQWDLGFTSGYQSVALDRVGYKAVMVPMLIGARYYMSETPIRGYFEGQVGLVWRRYDFSRFIGGSSFEKGTSNHIAPQYALGVGVAFQMMPSLEFDLGIQIDESPKGIVYETYGNRLPDGFSQSRFLVAVRYRI